MPIMTNEQKVERRKQREEARNASRPSRAKAPTELLANRGIPPKRTVYRKGLWVWA